MSADSFSSGIGILDPTTYNYEDQYADGVLKVVDWYYSDGVEYTSKICNCKVYYDMQGGARFRHNGRRYKLNDFMSCNI